MSNIIDNILLQEKETKCKKIRDYCNANVDKTKSELLQGLRKKFKLTDATAKKYYYDWKSEYLQTNECKPREIRAFGTSRKKRKSGKIFILDNIEYDTEKEGKYIKYVCRKDGIEVNGILFKSIADVEEFKREQFDIANKQLTEIKQLIEGIGL